MTPKHPHTREQPPRKETEHILVGQFSKLIEEKTEPGAGKPIIHKVVNGGENGQGPIVGSRYTGVIRGESGVITEIEFYQPEAESDGRGYKVIQKDRVIWWNKYSDGFIQTIKDGDTLLSYTDLCALYHDIDAGELIDPKREGRVRKLIAGVKRAVKR